MKISSLGISVIAAIFATQVEAKEFFVPSQDMGGISSRAQFYPSSDPVPYAEGDSAKELFNNSNADMMTSHGGGIRAQTKQISENVECYRVSNIEDLEKLPGYHSPDLEIYQNLDDPSALYGCKYFGPFLGS